jgi:hypothetical protein
MAVEAASSGSAIVTAVIAGVVALVVALITTSVAFLTLQRQFKLEDAAERVARALLQKAGWRWRTFRMIQHHLGGFTPNELRKILVRAGAVRGVSKDGEEIWGLFSEVSADIGIDQPDGKPLPDENPPAPKAKAARPRTSSPSKTSKRARRSA